MTVYPPYKKPRLTFPPEPEPLTPWQELSNESLTDVESDSELDTLDQLERLIDKLLTSIERLERLSTNLNLNSETRGSPTKH